MYNVCSHRVVSNKQGVIPLVRKTSVVRLPAISRSRRQENVSMELEVLRLLHGDNYRHFL